MARLVAERADVIPVLAEVFRQHGYEGASLSLIGNATGLGKGSLYHFFPGGKEEMAAAVLDEIARWFRCNVFSPLREGPDPVAAIRDTLQAVEEYFWSGRRVCLVGALALGDARDRFAVRIRGYFTEWREAMAGALERAGYGPADATARAEDALVGIQGGLVLARALDDPSVFERVMSRMRPALLERSPAANCV